MSVVEFTTDDPDLVLAYNVVAHDEASNRYKPTSLKDSLSEIDWGLFGLFLQAWRGNAYFTELAERVERGNYEDFVDVARRYKARTPGGEWPKVQTALAALYGPSKRTPSVLFARARLARLRRARAYADGGGSLRCTCAARGSSGRPQDVRVPHGGGRCDPARRAPGRAGAAADPQRVRPREPVLRGAGSP